jgi:hypothetical protein
MPEAAPYAEEDILTITDHKGQGDDDVLIADGTMEFLDSVISGKHTPEQQEEEDIVSVDVIETDEDTVQPVKTTPAQAQPAEVAKDEVEVEEDPAKNRSEPGPADRNRVYLGNITDPVTLEAMHLLERNPKLSMSKAEELAKQALGITEEKTPDDDGTVSYDDLPLAEKIEFDKAEFKEISAQIIEKQRIGLHDEEWETLVGKKDELTSTIAKNEVRLELLEDKESSESARLASEQEASLATIEATEAELAKEFTDLGDEDSLLYAAVKNQSERLMGQYVEGKAPDWFKPTSPESMKRIVQEQHNRITGKSTPVAKPGVTEVGNRTHQAKGPVAAKPTHSIAQLRSIPGSEVETRPRIVASGSDDDFLSSLDDVIAGKATPPSRSSRFEIV